ncbi:DUF3885 domain-containing protein [Rhabdobacter roseus]|uniref:DUF3885 domain-containing protein n=1 Tax=Rhabdobacter roseus TaxID=1655419 RepID=A0A840TUL1_9BACT|nr:DUF3885 domain-containing protein [Rhabdobacter roseus]MBB5283748.1 hypothetical protein [Rhabdobacter roseus]
MSKMLRHELQSYFDKVYPYSKINTEYTLGGQVHIRFELGEGKSNGTIERVEQSTERALTIFNDTFNDPFNEIFVLIYDDPAENFFSNASSEYLYKQFPAEAFEKFYNQFEIVNTRFFETDENGNEVVKKDNVKIIIGQLPVKNINAKNILNGIANLEMGFCPGVDQMIFFFDPLTDRAFQMYDDRGCFVWSNKADNIRDIYVKRNDWIVECHRPEIDGYFR